MHSTRHDSAHNGTKGSLLMSTKWSISFGPCTGDGVNRRRSVPRGTVGNLLAVHKYQIPTIAYQKVF